MKSILRTASIILCIIIFLLVLCSCGEQSEPHNGGTLPGHTTTGGTAGQNGTLSSTVGSSCVHVEETILGKAATCNEDGLTDGVKCSVCNEVLKEQEVIEASGHVEQVLPGREATRTEDGYTEMVKCSVCGKTLVPRYQIPATGIWSGSAATSFAGGTGTEADPYLISNGEQLALLASSINNNDNNAYYDKHYKLTDNIDLGGKEWDPIGCMMSDENYKSKTRTFRGVFDGNGFTITNFKITSPKKAYYGYFGLFGCISGATVKNLCITDFNIDVNAAKSSVQAGGITGLCGERSVIIGCYAAGTVNAKTSAKDAHMYAGGVAGYMSYGVQIKNCYTDVNVSAYRGAITNSNGRAYIGGIVGYAYWGSSNSVSVISDCSSVGEVSSSPMCEVYAGGIVGSLQSYCNIKNCYSASNVSVKSDSPVQAGGIAGEISKDTSITNCVYTGNVSAVGTGRNSVAAGDISGNEHKNASIVSCFCLKGRSIISKNEVSNPFYEPKYAVVGTACEAVTLNSGAFYTSTLGWDESVWELSSLDILDGKHPKMKAWN